MEEEKQNIISQIFSYILVALIFVFLFGVIVARVWYFGENPDCFSNVTEKYALILYPLFSFICGFLALSLNRNLETGEENGWYANYSLIILIGSALYCTVKFIVELFEIF